VRLLGVLTRTGKSLADLFDELPKFTNTPEIRIDCPDERKFAVVEEIRDRLATEGADVDDIDGVRVSVDGGWWLLRASNTQAVLVARCEARDDALLEDLKTALRGALAASGIDADAV
jgi:phosphomannomutase